MVVKDGGFIIWMISIQAKQIMCISLVSKNYRFGCGTIGGDLSFHYLKHLIPNLFSNWHESNFKCEICILAKSHHVPYLTRVKKCKTSFTLFHSDLWGLLSFLSLQVLDGMWPLLMILHPWLNFIWWKINMMYLVYFNPFML